MKHLNNIWLQRAACQRVSVGIKYKAFSKAIKQTTDLLLTEQVSNIDVRYFRVI